MRILPFRGYRYNPGRISNLDEVISLPYDQFKAGEDSRFHQRHPYNIAHLIMNPETSQDSPTWNRYTRSRQLLDQWMNESVFIQDPNPSIYPYYQEFQLASGERKTRKGFVALGEATDYAQRVVRPHERTMAKPKQDRLQLLRSTLLDSGLVFVLYSDPGGDIEAVLDTLTERPPDMTASGPAEVINRLWQVSDDRAITRIQQAMHDKAVIIADGHHRFEVAVQFSQEAMKRCQENPVWEQYRYKLISFVRLESSALAVFPLHRVLQQLETLEMSGLFQRLEPFFSIESTAVSDEVPEEVLKDLLKRMRRQQEAGHTALGWFAPQLGQLALLNFRRESAAHLPWPADKSETWRQLDVSILQVAILSQLLNLGERELAEGNYLEYVSDAREAVQRAACPPGQCAFLLNSTPIEQVKAVVEAGDLLPQKSTHFHPKLMEGLVFAKHL